jgi:Domain of unknown function (DUF4402)
MGTRPFFKRQLRVHALRGLAALLLGSSAALVPTVAAQAAPGTQTGDARIIVLRQLSFFKVDDLEFGDIVPSNVAGVVRIQPSGVRSATGGVTLVGAVGQPARFAGLGTYNRQVDISVSANSIQITGPGAPMTVSQFEIGSTPTAILSTTPMRFRIGAANGQFNFPVGARLAVGANQAPGDYVGTFAITLNYL